MLVSIKETTLERAYFTVTLTVNVCDRGKGEANVYNFLSLYILSAVFPPVLSKDRLNASWP